jgi:putative oxidoreductase
LAEVTRSAKPHKQRPDLLGWALRIIVAIVFLYEGVDKFGSRRLWIRLFSEIGIGQWFRYATGIVEVVGAVLLLIPKATRIAVTMLGCTMAGAFLAHIFITGIGPQSVAVAILFAALITIGWRHRTWRREVREVVAVKGLGTRD